MSELKKIDVGHEHLLLQEGTERQTKRNQESRITRPVLTTRDLASKKYKPMKHNVQMLDT